MVLLETVSAGFQMLPSEAALTGVSERQAVRVLMRCRLVLQGDNS